MITEFTKQEIEHMVKTNKQVMLELQTKLIAEAPFWQTEYQTAKSVEDKLEKMQIEALHGSN